jgi:hypothetical protein
MKYWTTEEIIKQQEDEFNAFIAEKEKQTPLTLSQKDSYWEDFYVNCEHEATLLNMKIDEENEDFNIDLNEIEQATITEEKFTQTLNKKWMELFNKRSYCNTVPGKIIFRILLSTALKNKTFIGFNGKILSPAMHLFVIQSAGSGKDQAMDFLEIIVDEINKQNILKHQKPMIKLYNFLGNESTESLLDSFGNCRNNKGNLIPGCDYNNTIPGVLSENDIIISRECSFLFREQNKEKQMKREILLTAMEGRTIPKKLLKWEGHQTNTKSNFCFIGCSRPIENMKQHIVSSGLQQRAFNYCRDVDSKLRKEMLKQMIKNGDIGNSETTRSFNRDVITFANEFIDLVEWAQATEFKIQDDEEVKKIIYTNLIQFYDNIVNTIRSREHKLILESFVARFKDLILILAYQNAILQRRVVVTKTDVQSGITAIKQTFDELKLWVEDTIEESKEEKYKYFTIKNNLTSILKNGALKKRDVVKHLMRLGKHSEVYCYKLIQQNLSGDNSLLITTDDKLIDLRKETE